GPTGTAGSERTVTEHLTAEETTALLREVPRIYRARVPEAMFTALALAWREWTGRPEVLVDMENHGREEVFDGVDVSRTAGWFTIACPVLLTPGDEGAGTALLRIKDQLRAVPDRGLDFLSLLHLNPAAADALRALPVPPVRLNYLGQFDQFVSASELFSVSGLDMGPERSPAGRRPHLLRLDAFVVGDRLRMDFKYSHDRHTHEDVSALAAAFVGALRILLDPDTAAARASYHSPSDFPDVDLTAGELDDVLGQLGTVD
ncbi:condensation domain-containing protein, partial [Streptomyces sp. W16]|uniref:condensation domain-containing protein n=1 Tax=Streptomyces sp. W16 TaxID=3076631 RepID=UPI00295BD7E1